VPLVVGMTEDTAVARLAAEPLGAELLYKPAQPGKPSGTVVKQTPRSGGPLSANDEVTLVVTKARYGLLPNFVGSSIDVVRRELKRLRLRARIVTAPGPAGTVLRQKPRAGVSSAPGLRVKIVVGAG
jgi:beta-lactam-binding protein with PASTA domain